LPIFNLYPLKTVKYLDFKDWETSFLLWVNSSNSYTVEEKLNKFKELKSGMNTSRTQFDTKLLPKDKLNPLWLLGFVEGDGSFQIKTADLKPNFSISQHKKSIQAVELIRDFILSLPYDLPKGFSPKAKFIQELNLFEEIENNQKYIVPNYN
jgi:hypothetical protein